MTDSPDSREARVKRAIMRASHRGMKEMDIIFGRFARAECAGMDDAELEAFETLMRRPDQALYAWFSGRAASAPADLSEDEAAIAARVAARLRG